MSGGGGPPGFDVVSNCSTCEYKLHPDGGWCYMFKEAPQGVCRKHKMTMPMSAGAARKILEGVPGERSGSAGGRSDQG